MNKEEQILKRKKFGIVSSGRIVQNLGEFNSILDAEKVAGKLFNPASVVEVEIFLIWYRYGDNEKDFITFLTDKTSETAINEAKTEALNVSGAFAITDEENRTIKL